MSMTISGRIVKRPGRMTLSAGQVVQTRQIVRAMRRAKAAPWAGVVYHLTAAALAAAEAQIENAETEEAEDAARNEETLSDIRRRYSIVQDGSTLTLTGTVNGDFALIRIDTEGSDLRCFYQGTQAHRPSVAYELAAQLWLAENGGAAESALAEVLR